MKTRYLAVALLVALIVGALIFTPTWIERIRAGHAATQRALS